MKKRGQNNEIMCPRSHASKLLNWNFNPGNPSYSVYDLRHHIMLLHKYVKEAETFYQFRVGLKFLD